MLDALKQGLFCFLTASLTNTLVRRLWEIHKLYIFIPAYKLWIKWEVTFHINIDKY